MQEKPIRFSQLLELHLNTVIKKQASGSLLTPAKLREVRETLREHLTHVFAKSTHRLSFEALAWLTDQYFTSIEVNGEQSVSELIILNEYKLDALPFSDVELLHNLFNETKLGPVLEAEHRRRSAS